MLKRPVKIILQYPARSLLCQQLLPSTLPNPLLYSLALKVTSIIVTSIRELITMPDTWEKSWTNHEREYRIDHNRFYKRSFRPSEYELDWRNEPSFHPWVLNELPMKQPVCDSFEKRQTFQCLMCLRRMTITVPLSLSLGGFGELRWMNCLQNTRLL